MKNYFIYTFIIILLFLGTISFLYVGRYISSKTLQHEIINPNNEIQCIVISGNDSTAVDCWRNK